MKKAFVLGMVALTMTAQVSFGATTAAKTPREMVTKYAEMVKKAVIGEKGAQALDAAKFDAAKQRVIGKLNSTRGTELSGALSGEAGKTRLETVTTILAVKMASENLAKADPAEAKSMDAAAEASIKLIANSQLVDNMKVDTNNKDLALAGDVLKKMETMPADIIMQFNKSERDSYTEVLNKYDAIASTGKTSPHESLIQAVMEVKKVDRAKALEILQKLKECV